MQYRIIYQSHGDTFFIDYGSEEFEHVERRVDLLRATRTEFVVRELVLIGSNGEDLITGWKTIREGIKI